MTMAMGVGCMLDEEYTKKNCKIIEENRKYTADKLKEMGFEMTNSTANFLFAKHPEFSGEKLYLEHKKRGILIRHFNKEEIEEYNRITVGTKEQMDCFLTAVKEILEANK